MSEQGFTIQTMDGPVAVPPDKVACRFAIKGLELVVHVSWDATLGDWHTGQWRVSEPVSGCAVASSRYSHSPEEARGRAVRELREKLGRPDGWSRLLAGLRRNQLAVAPRIEEKAALEEVRGDG